MNNFEKDFKSIAKGLEKFHSIFKQIWEIGVPEFSESIERAAIAFNKKGKEIKFLFNPKFWNEIDDYTKEFVICHECLHVILNHGVRAKNIIGNKIQEQITNIAQDIVINHMLIDNFNFDRHSICLSKDLCWIDTIFKENHTNIERDRSFEYYYGLLKKDENLYSRNTLYIILDDHSLLGDFSEDSISFEEFLNETDKNDFVEKVKKFEESKISKKTNREGYIHNVTNIKTNRKRKWESVIKNWALKQSKDFEENEKWGFTNRRYMSIKTNAVIPGEFEEQKKQKSKIDVFFFIDTSGSCIDLKDRFFSVAKSLPKDLFVTKFYSFDDKVYKVDINSNELRGGFGTSFRIIEEEIQKYLTNNPDKKYPNAVFIITDGYGDAVYPQKPKNWHWFLTEFGSKNLLPKESKIFQLKDFE